MQIKYLERFAIDDLRWNNCIDESINGIVYAYTWYLDIVSPNWSALIADNYEYVFPLPGVKRFGVEMLLQPLFTQQLGLFSKLHITPEILQEFIVLISQRYKYINLHLNTLNRLSERLHSKDRVTYQLDLIPPYAKIQEGYHQNTRRNNLKSTALDVSVVREIPPETFVEFFKNNAVVKLKALNFNQIERIVRAVKERNLGYIVGAYSQGALCAAAFIVNSNGKLIYLFASSSYLGMKNRAMFAVVDQVIRWNAESHLVLDFEGSMIPSVARFYAGFGAMPCVYQNLVLDGMPFYLKLIYGIKNVLKKNY